MGRADAAAIASGIPGPVLMENAGRAIARAIQARFRPCRTLVLAGPGNNGGDGYVVARLLAQRGWPVSVAVLAAPRPGTDAAGAAARWRGPMKPFTPQESARADLVIDAVFGAGLARNLDPAVAHTLHAARRLVAVDVPSGLDGTTGMPRGYAPQAALTVTFFRLKPGHLLLPGRDLCGEIVLADIGLPSSVLAPIAPRTFANVPGLWSLPGLAGAAHKYSRGHVSVLGGTEMTGAAQLAAMGARRAGAGMLTIACPPGAASVFRAGNPGVIVNAAPLAEQLSDQRRMVWVCGPGLGVEAAAVGLPALLDAGRVVVGDADVFSAFAGHPEDLVGCAVLTPHVGEFVRAFGMLGADRLINVRSVARRTRAVVLLKGADTIIAAPDGRAAVNASAPPWLATAGTGDVLAGMIGGLLAQGMPAWEATCAAVYLHGRAAAHAGPGMVAEDIPRALAQSFAEI